ncbi:MAG: hypothetical protein JSW10_01520 [Pseudomonadota bacterium]|nr:MAG: hypothetical protein JSW10_01520 [Pseudomonadota bacterium]
MLFVLLEHGDVEQSFALSCPLGAGHASQRQDDNASPQASVQRLYVSLQLYGMLDVNTWLGHLLDFPEKYLCSLDSPVTTASDSGQELGVGYVVVYANSDGPPLHQRTESNRAASLVIDFSKLLEQLVAEHEELARMIFISAVDPARLSTPLATLDEQDRIPVLELMLLGLQRRERRHQRHLVVGSERLTLNFGFAETFKLMSGYARPADDDSAEARANVEKVQQASIELAERDVRHRASHWQIVNFSTGGLMLAGVESEEAGAASIGQVVAFKPEGNNNRPLLGYVGRIHRPQDGELEVSVIRLASHAEAALAIDMDIAKSGAGRPVLLIKDFDEHWHLYVPFGYRYTSGTPMRLVRSDGSTVLARLGDIWLTKRDFTVFDMRASGL